MIDEFIKELGRERVENLAIETHTPVIGNYVLVDMQGRFKVINERKMKFNSRYCGMDYYSGLVSMNKPVADKQISSNNYHTFWVNKIDTLKPESIDKYYDKLNLPAEYNYRREWIKNNIYTIGGQYPGRIKVFFDAPYEEYRKMGIAHWKEKCITHIPCAQIPEGYGMPVGVTYNSKKDIKKITEFKNSDRCLITRDMPFLVENQTTFYRKLFFDFLLGLSRSGYDQVVFDRNFRYYPISKKDNNQPVYPKIGSMLIGFIIDKTGQVVITQFESIVC